MPYTEAQRASKRAYYLAHREQIIARVKTHREANRDRLAEYRRANREKRNAQRREWGLRNPDKLKALALKRTPEQHRESARKNYAKTPELHKQRSQAWRKANPDKLREQQRRYRKANAPKVYDKNAVRRARLKGATVERVDRRVVFERHGGICGICRSPVAFDAMTLDHIVPLVAGGPHNYANVQPAHRSCNSSKGARMPAAASTSRGNEPCLP